MKVSVVVPVYNTGSYIADLIDSLRAQTLARSQFEVVFVDDGSTDGTSARLDQVAAEMPNVRVIHTPNSGWPGRPRNIGIDAAVGEYVFLADHDDRLDPAALDRLTAFADLHGSDVVVGKMIGVGRTAPRALFDRTRIDAQDDPEMLMTSLTPQKLYRRAFLNERGIRFPEGKRRLEDHLFVTKAYVRAGRVSVYSDHPVYYFVIRDDGNNASRRRVEWKGYFTNAAESIEVVDAEVHDETRRVVMRRRWLRTEALARVRGARFVGRRFDRDVLVDAVRDLIERFYPMAEIDLLAVGDRIAARLVLERRDDDLEAFARWEASIRVRPRLVAAHLDQRRQLLELSIRADQRATVPRPAFLAHLPASYPHAGEVDAMERIPRTGRVTAALRHVGSGATVESAVQQSVEQGVLQAAATFDLQRSPILRDGRWTLQTRFGGVAKVPAGDVVVDPPDRDRIASAARLDGHIVRLDVGDAGRLLLRVTSGTDAVTARRVASAVLRRLRLRR